MSKYPRPTPVLSHTVSHPSLSKLIDATPILELAAGQLAFRSDERCHCLPVLESGSVCVYARGHGNRQVILYRLQAGDICPVSLSALLQDSVYPAEAVAESATEIRYLPADKLKSLFTKSPELLGLILEKLAFSLYGAIQFARQLVFDPLDVRLALLLSEQFSCNPSQRLCLTHSDIANELGTTRVVVSRMLKKLEHENCIQLHRGGISLAGKRALQKLVKIGQKASVLA